MYASETINGKRVRALTKGVMDSDVPTHLLGKRRRVGNPHLAFVAEKEGAMDCAKWQHTKMREKLDTQLRKDPSAPFVNDGRGSVLSASAAEERNRLLRQKLTALAERVRADLARKADVGEWDAWREFKVPEPVHMGAQNKDVADTRWMITWEGAEGKQTASVQLVAKGCQDPALKDGNVDIAGFAGGRSTHVQSISVGP